MYVIQDLLIGEAFLALIARTEKNREDILPLPLRAADPFPRIEGFTVQNLTPYAPHNTLTIYITVLSLPESKGTDLLPHLGFGSVAAELSRAQGWREIPGERESRAA